MPEEGLAINYEASAEKAFPDDGRHIHTRYRSWRPPPAQYQRSSGTRFGATANEGTTDKAGRLGHCPVTAHISVMHAFISLFEGGMLDSQVTDSQVIESLVTSHLKDAAIDKHDTVISLPEKQPLLRFGDAMCDVDKDTIEEDEFPPSQVPSFDAHAWMACVNPENDIGSDSALSEDRLSSNPQESQAAIGIGHERLTINARAESDDAWSQDLLRVLLPTEMAAVSRITAVLVHNRQEITHLETLVNQQVDRHFELKRRILFFEDRVSQLIRTLVEHGIEVPLEEESQYV
ncbi:hypothetical protein C8Q76DRAFT_695683 [Earliella scabrosa]|nr:hypothetical protein C8Q76DRAFT_695683 [Earliella scabrosa]